MAVRRASGGSTAVALSLPGLREATVDRLADGLTVAARVRGGVALAVLPGIAEAADLRVTARLADGSSRTALGGLRRTQDADPTGMPPWVADFDAAHPRSARRTACVTVAQRESTPAWAPTAQATARSSCGNLRRNRFLVAVRRAYQFDTAARRPRVRQTVIFGAIGRRVADVRIAAARTFRRPSISPHGRAFIAVYPGQIPRDQIAISFRFPDGSETVVVGRRAVQLGPPRETRTPFERSARSGRDH